MPHSPKAEDTIVVKGNYSWSHPSTDSNGSPLRTPSLPQSNTFQNLESPEFLDEEIPTTGSDKLNTGAVPTILSPNYIKRQLTMEERLQAMPEKRPLPWRPGIEPGAEVETGGDSRRKQIRFGCLLATRG